MNVQLLLLLALAGPFCAFTHAIPTGATTTDVYATEQSSEPSVPTTHAIPEETTGVGHTLFTGPPATAPATAEVVTVVTSAVPAVTEKEDEETQSTVPAATVAPHPRFTDPPAVETAAPTHPATAEDKTETTGAAETDMGDEVVVEDGLSSGQVVGIVIGALLAVVIVIAVVIAVVRRMGKYSSAKIKKPAKKDSAMVSSLRRKSAKQQERSKFWKF